MGDLIPARQNEEQREHPEERPLLAAFTWQVRFLPALLMIALALLGLRTRARYPDDPARIRTVCVALPLVMAVLAYAWLTPAIIQAVRIDADRTDQATLSVRLGQVITVDDRMTALLDKLGAVHFVPNDQVRSQTLCPDRGRAPYSEVEVRGWPAEDTALEWLMPRRPSADPDPRCEGRLLEPPSGTVAPAGSTADPPAGPAPDFENNSPSPKVDDE